MKIKTILIQNIFLVLGIAAITFLGIPFNDDGVQWTDAMATGYGFLTFGVILIIASIGILFWKVRSMSQSQ